MRLGELQTAMLAAVLGDAPERVAAAVLDDGPGAQARLAIYGQHVVTTLTEVLQATYAVVCRLVGEGFFAYAAGQYIRRHPPMHPCLFEYGSAFADFLATFPACRHLAYLPDVARLEWAMNVAEHADDVIPLDPRALRRVEVTDTPRLRFTFDPSLTLLESPWPVDRIWRANQPQAHDATVDLAAGAAHLQVRRAGTDIVCRSLSAGYWGFCAALTTGRTLEEAATIALGRDPSFDLASALHTLLTDGIVTDFRLAP